MKVGVCVLQGSRPFEESFRQMEENGFDNCQILSWNPEMYTKEESRSIRESAEKHGIHITAFWCGWTGPGEWNLYDGQVTLGLVPAAYRMQRTAEIKNGSDFAASLGVRDIITHVGFIPENPFDPAYPGTVAAVRDIARHARNNNQYFNFETGQETPTTLARTIEDAGEDNLGVNLDPANLIMYGKANPCDAIGVLGKYVRGVHAKDGFYPTDGRHLGKEAPLGEGKVNFPRLIRKLRQAGYDGALTIEREITGEQQTADILRGRELLNKILEEENA